MQTSIPKTVIILQTPQSAYFEQAHLILRSGVSQKEPTHAIVEEANRIILQAEAGKIRHKIPKERESASQKLLWFFLGMLSSLAVGAVSVLLYSLAI